MLLLLCLGAFIFFRLQEHRQKQTHLPSHKPVVSQGEVVHKAHPWLSLQPLVIGAEREIARDLEKVHELSLEIGDISEETLTYFLTQTLTELQKELPFTFPAHLYNVLMIPEAPRVGPDPFQIYKRLYLGETELGLPFYLDVRRYHLEGKKKDTIISWYLSLIEGELEKVKDSDQALAYVIRGKRNEDQLSAPHGFAQFLGERGLFLLFVQQGDQLFVCYAEASLSTFQQHLPLLSTLFT